MTNTAKTYNLEDILDIYKINRCDRKTSDVRQGKHTADDDVAVERSEYDLETFLDAYKPLCPSQKSKTPNNLSHIQKRLFKEGQLTNNPLSYIRREKKEKEGNECSQHMKMTQQSITDNSNTTKFKRRDSGYSSHSSYHAQNEFQEQKCDKPLDYSHIEYANENTMAQSKKSRNTTKDSDSKSTPSKLKHIKKKFRKSSDKDETKENEKNNNVWKRAKTHASKLKTRFSKTEIKVERGSPLIVNTPKIVSNKKRNKQTTDRGFPSRQNSFNRHSFQRNSYTGKARVKDLRFEDNFTTPRLAPKRDYSRQTSRRRPRSLYSNFDQNMTIQFPAEEDSVTGIFDEKYLNQSCPNLFDNDDMSLADVFLDEDTSFEVFNEINFDQFNLDHENIENDDVIEDTHDAIGGVTFDDDHFDIENEVENYYEATETSNNKFYVQATAI